MGCSLYFGAAGVSHSHDSCGFVECFSCGVVACLSDHAEASVGVHEYEFGVSSGYDEAGSGWAVCLWSGDFGVLDGGSASCVDPCGVDVSCEVVDAYEGYVEGGCESFCDVDSDDEGAGESRAVGYCDCVDPVPAEAGLPEGSVEYAGYFEQVLSGGDFRYDAAESGV